MLILSVIVIESYLIGSIPFGYLAGRLAGIDIRTAGSGNIGATNVVRILGKRYGYPVFILDFLKGLAAARISIAIAAGMQPKWASPEIFGIVAAVSAVVGHSFPPWLKFKGGKGVATSTGAFFGLMPLATLAGLSVWIIVFWMSRYVSLASVVATAALPLLIFLLSSRNTADDKALFYGSLCLAAVVIWRHRSNLSRLMRRTEPRFNRK
jgi:acyl phosphate:glycerol-3-phosphate acyltransferase